MKREKTWNDRWVGAAAAALWFVLTMVIWGPGIAVYVVLNHLHETFWLGWTAQVMIQWHCMERLTPHKNKIITRFTERYSIRYKEMYPS